MQRFNNILCVVEPTTTSEAAIVQAVKLSVSQQAKLKVVSTINPSGWLSSRRLSSKEHESAVQQAIEDKRREVREWTERYTTDLPVAVDILVGTEFIEIIKCVLRDKTDLLVKCCEAVDWASRLFGSNDMHLLRKCPCPVLMVKPGQTNVFKQVMATVDVNEDDNEGLDCVERESLNRQVLEYACVFGLSELAEMFVASVWRAVGEDFLRYGPFAQMPDEKVDDYVKSAQRDAENRLEKLIRDMHASLGDGAKNFLNETTVTAKGNPSTEIPKLALDKGIDLLVMGTVARTGIPGLIIGNTAESILEQVQCSVLAIKPEGFESPVRL